MAPQQQPTSRKHKNERNADSAVQHQAPLTISTEQISPANQQHTSNDFFTREQRWRTAFESSAIGITMADLDGHYLAANTAFQKMVSYKWWAINGCALQEGLRLCAHDGDAPANPGLQSGRFAGGARCMVL